MAHNGSLPVTFSLLMPMVNWIDEVLKTGRSGVDFEVDSEGGSPRTDTSGVQMLDRSSKSNVDAADALNSIGSSFITSLSNVILVI
jgi:hypothetical protein